MSRKAIKTITELSQENFASLYTRGTLQRVPSSSFKPADNINKRVGLYQELTSHAAEGDITSLQVDAIVNAANKDLRGGGGVDGAIHKAAGPKLLEACAPLGGCDPGDAKITPGFDLPAKNVIHAVGPIYSSNKQQQSEEKLRSCYRRSLELCVEHGLRTVAFNCISTGVYSYPNDQAAEIALNEVRRFMESPDGAKLDLVLFCIFLDKDWAIYLDQIPKIFPESPAQAQGEAGAVRDSETSGGTDEGAKGSLVEKHLLPAEN